MNLAALALLPALAFGAAPAGPKRIAVLMVPMDQGAEASTVRLEAYMNEALDQYPGLKVKRNDELFGLPSDEEAEAALKRAELGFTESREAFMARDDASAERKLRATLKEFGKAAGALKSCGHLCDATAMLAATLLAKGEVEDAKITLVDLIALSPTYEIDRKRFPQEFLSLRAQVATGRAAQLRGNLTVRSKPAGARVYVDGEFQGYTPLTVQTLQVGRHLVRLERPGCKIYGALAEVSPEDSLIEPRLSATAAYKAYDALLDKLAAEVLRDKGGATMTSIGRTLGVEEGIVGVVKELDASGATELKVGLYEFKTGKLLAGKRQVFQGDEYGQLKSEMGRLVNHLVNFDNNEKVVKTSDPLDSRHGMDEWNSEDRGGNRSASEKRKRGKDPLEGVNGTEDW